jgi:TonB-linked SusC/RagA family outer membrane protein
VPSGAGDVQHDVAPLALRLAVLALVLGAPLLPTITNPLHAQTPAPAARGTSRVTGTVTEAGGQPLASVQVLIVGTQLGALSGPDGRFTITGVPAGTFTVRAQRIGFSPQTREVAVAAGQSVTTDFQLAGAATQLTAVSVVGYTNEQRRDISGAVTTVSGDELRDQVVATVEEALRGRAPGVQIASSGQPGRPAQIIVRGQNGFGDPSPLYVVDGMYIGTQNPNLNPDDIASISVLKDASAAAQYGAQASNGVVVITTRRGQAGENRVSFSSFYGVQELPKRLPLASASEFQRIYTQAYANANATRPANQQLVVPTGVSQPATQSTDWQDALFQRGAIQNYNLTASGGSPTASYLLSGGVLDQEGTVMNTGFRRYSVRVNSEATRGRLTIGEALAISQARQTDFPNGIFGNQAFPLIDVVGLLPTIPVRDPANPGGYGYGSDANPNYGVNPVAVLESNYNRRRANQVLGSGYADVRLVGSLRYRLNLGINYSDSLARTWTSSRQVRYLTPVLTGASLNQASPNAQQLLYENLLNYDGGFGDDAHRVSAVFGQTSQRNEYSRFAAFRQGFVNEQLQQINAGSTAGARDSGYTTPFRTNSLLARATYAFRDRYLITANARRDCSSRFSPGNRCGTFGAGSVGWVVSEEGFWKSIPLLGGADFLKLRASTGVLGDQNIGDLRYFVPVSQNANYVTNGPSGATVISGGATQTQLANTDLRWQRNRSTDFGLDLGLLDNALTLTMDYYVNDADQLLVNLPLPGSLASDRDPAVNAGKVRNAGFELGATHRLERGDFGLNTTFNLTTTANRVVSLGNGGQPISAGLGDLGIARTAVGHPIGAFFLKKTCGIFQNAAEVTAHAAQPTAQPGDLCFVDQNGDKAINDQDRIFFDNPVPKLNTGLFVDSRWRSLDFGVNLRGAFGHRIYNAVKLATERTVGLNNLRAGYSPWTPENTNTSTPRAVFGDPVNGDPVSDRWLEKGDFVRLQNIVVGVRIPERLLQSARIGLASSPRLYLNVQNVATFTNYSGFDPEVLGQASVPTAGAPAMSWALARGIDDGLIYPNPRTFTLGLDVRF